MTASFIRPALVAGVLLSAGLPLVAQQGAKPRPGRSMVCIPVSEHIRPGPPMEAETTARAPR